MFKTVDQKTKLERLKVCIACENYIRSIQTCKLCKCYVPAKTMFAQTTCPDNRWIEQAAGTDLISKIEESILKMWNEAK